MAPVQNVCLITVLCRLTLVQEICTSKLIFLKLKEKKWNFQNMIINYKFSVSPRKLLNWVILTSFGISPFGHVWNLSYFLKYFKINLSYIKLIDDVNPRKPTLLFFSHIFLLYHIGHFFHRGNILTYI
jgi:hypothetical protein